MMSPRCFVAVRCRASEDERIVGGAVEFDGGHFAGLREGIADGAVDLRRAAQAVGVLHARIFVASRDAIRGSGCLR